MTENTKKDRRIPLFWFLTLLAAFVSIELGARLIERVENKVARHKNPFVVAVNYVPAFKVVDMNGAKMVVRSGFHPLMNPELRPFPLIKPPGGLRIFVLGGSAAAGWPYHVGNTNISALLERKLRMLYPGKSIEVIPATAGTYASHRVKIILEEVLQYKPDAIFLYNGNNEFLEQLVYRSQNPPTPWNYSAFIRLVYRIVLPPPRIDIKNYGIEAQIPNTLSFAFSKVSLYRQDSQQFQMLLAHYRYNLEAMVSASKKARVPLFFLTCPVNLRDWVPNVSRHRKGLTSEENARWTNFFREGILALERGDLVAAEAMLRASIDIDGEYAEAHYRLAEVLRRLGRLYEAKAEYILALQRDAFPFRELPEFQNILRQVSEERKVPLVDIVKTLEGVTKDGIIGDDILIDYCHLSEQSQEIVAQEMLKALWRQGVLQGVSEVEIERHRISIPETFWTARDIMAADLNYGMAMVMHQYERLDKLFNKAIEAYTRAANEDPSRADDYRSRILSLRVIHRIASSYRDLFRAQKLGIQDRLYTPEEVQKIYSDYRWMIYEVVAKNMSWEEFLKSIPDAQFDAIK